MADHQGEQLFDQMRQAKKWLAHMTENEPLKAKKLRSEMRLHVVKKMDCADGDINAVLGNKRHPDRSEMLAWLLRYLLRRHQEAVQSQPVQ